MTSSLPPDLPADLPSGEPDATADGLSSPAPERTRFAEPATAAPPPAPEEAAPEPVAEVTAVPVGPPEPVVEVAPAGPPEPVEGASLPPVPDLAPAEPSGDTAAVPARRGRGLVTVLAALVAALALLTGFLGWRVQQTQGAGPVAASGSAGLDAARAAARLVFSYDYRHLAQDFKAGRATTTGQFQADYDKTTARLLADVAPRYKAVVVAVVSDAAVVTATENRVLTLVFLNQQSSSTLIAQPKVTQARVEMTMVRTRGQWLVSTIRGPL